MRYSVDDLKAMAFDFRDPFSLFVNANINRVPNNVRTVDDALVINCRPETDGRDIPDFVTYYEGADTRDCMLRNVYAFQLDGALRVPKGTSVFTIYRLVNRKDARFILVQNDAQDLTYHVSVNGECRVVTRNQAGDPIQYIVVQADNGVYQIAEVMDFDARRPVTRDEILEMENRYPLSTFDPDYGDKF